MSNTAAEFLGWFLDACDRQPDRQRKLSKKFPGFRSMEDRLAFEAALQDAARLGAVSLVRGRGDASHLIEKVVLIDPMPLYDLLNRSPLSSLASEAARRLHDTAAALLPEVRGLAEEISSAWTRRAQPYGFPIGDPGTALLLRSLDAVLRREDDDNSDMRTYSRRMTGNSKAIEHNAGAIGAYLRKTGRIDADLDDLDALAAFGVAKFPQPVLISGRLRLCMTTGGTIDLGEAAYLGVPPEHIASIVATRPVRTILTIENLASFQRHVREARRPDDVVVYVGGFPSRAVRKVLKAIIALQEDQVFHWGDIDEGGIRIATFIDRATGTRIRPHLMTAELARKHGTKAKPCGRINADGTAFSEIADFLAADDAHHIEQEELDPIPPVEVVPPARRTHANG